VLTASYRFAFPTFTQSFEAVSIVRSEKPINLRIFGTDISSAESEQALFQTSGGSLTIESSSISSLQVPQFLVANGTSVVIDEVTVQGCRFTEGAFVANEAATISAIKLQVEQNLEMKFLLQAEGLSSYVFLQNSTVTKNAVQPPLLWSVVSLRDSASALVQEVIVSENKHFDNVFSADRSSSMEISDLTVVNNKGGRSVVSPCAAEFIGR